MKLQHTEASSTTDYSGHLRNQSEGGDKSSKGFHINNSACWNKKKYKTFTNVSQWTYIVPISGEVAKEEYD